MKQSILLALALCCSASAFAEGSMHCGNSVISVGDTESDILMDCGSPTEEVDKTIQVPNENGVKTSVKIGEILIINQGNDQSKVTVENGVITEIQTGPKQP